jgi:hypothetical protein
MFIMLSKFTLAAAAGAVALTAMPAAAEASHRDGYRDYRYEQSYRGDRYQQSYRGDRYYAGDNYYRGQNTYYGDRYNNGTRCKGTTGTIVGGVAGALIGREVTRNSGRGFRRGGGGTTGAIIGGAIGALAGRAVAKSGCNDNRYYNDRYYR